MTSPARDADADALAAVDPDAGSGLHRLAAIGLFFLPPVTFFLPGALIDLFTDDTNFGRAGVVVGFVVSIVFHLIAWLGGPPRD